MSFLFRVSSGRVYISYPAAKHDRFISDRIWTLGMTGMQQCMVGYCAIKMTVSEELYFVWCLVSTELVSFAKYI